MRRISRSIALYLIVTVNFSCVGQSQSKGDEIPVSDAAKQKDNDKDAAFDKKIDVGGYGLHILCSAKPNKESPTVILEAGLNQSSETWNEVQPEVAKFTRVCSYDRAGLGKSDAPKQQQRNTSQQIVKDLHLLLEKAGINPPLVLVGHSFGGINVRLYASLYPKEVVAMVLVDSVHEEETEKWLAMIPTETRKQMEAAGAMQLLGSESIDLETSMKQMKAAKWHTTIPLIVLARGRASYNPDDYPPPLRSFAPKGEELRIKMQKNLASCSSKGKFLFAEKSGHIIQSDEPALVVDAIRQVVEATKPKGKT